MCVLLITRLLRGVGRWARKPVNHTSWVTVVTPTDRPKSVRNCCLIELFCGVVCVVALPLWHFCWCRGFCHRTGSDLLLFVFWPAAPVKNGHNMHYHRELTCKRHISCWPLDVKSTVVRGTSAFCKKICCNYFLFFISFIFMQIKSILLPF